MRRLVILLIALPMLACAFGPLVRNMMLEIASRRAEDGPNTDGLVAYWSMREDDGTVFDEHGDNDGAVSGGVTFGTAYGVRDDGADFAGQDGHATVPYNATLDVADQWTISAWVYLKKTHNISTMIVGRIFTGAQGLPYYLGFQGTDGGRPSAGFWNDAWYVAKSPEDPSLNTWMHLGATLSGVNIVLYLDGANVGEKTADNPPRSGNVQDLRIGRRWDGTLSPDNLFEGYIDEVRIYNRALTPAEITTLYNWDKAGAGH